MRCAFFSNMALAGRSIESRWTDFDPKQRCAFSSLTNTRRSSRATRVCSAGHANYGGVMEVDPNEPAVATYKLVVQSNTYEKNFVRPVS